MGSLALPRYMIRQEVIAAEAALQAERRHQADAVERSSNELKASHSREKRWADTTHLPTRLPMHSATCPPTENPAPSTLPSTPPTHHLPGSTKHTPTPRLHTGSQASSGN